MARKKKTVSKKTTVKRTAAGSRPKPGKVKVKTGGKSVRNRGARKPKPALKVAPDTSVFHDLADPVARKQVPNQYRGLILPEFRSPAGSPNRDFGVQDFSAMEQEDGGERGLPPMDAWFGSYGPGSSDAKLPGKQSRTEYSRQSIRAATVIGDDDRQQVHNTRQYPFGCLCSLEIVSKNNNPYVGTGWLVSPGTVITAGHCVYMHMDGGWIQSIGVYPGRNGADKPIARFAAGMYSVQGWLEDKQPESDYAAIRLNSPVNDIGTFGYQAATDSQLNSYNCHVVGYPSDKGGTMWGHVRRLRQVRERTLVYDIDTHEGNSGGPVFVVLDNRVLSVGIHNYGDLSGNSATRITGEVYDNIENWK